MLQINGRTKNPIWYVNNPVPEFDGAVVTFEASGHELDHLRHSLAQPYDYRSPVTTSRTEVGLTNEEDGSLDLGDEPEVLSHLQDVSNLDTYKHALEQIAERMSEIDWFDLSPSERFVLETAQTALVE